MPHAAVARTTTWERGAGRYQYHRSEQTLRNRIVAEITRYSLPIWRSRASNCRRMSDASSRITSSVGGWTMGSCGYVARAATSSIEGNGVRLDQGTVKNNMYVYVVSTSPRFQ